MTGLTARLRDASKRFRISALIRRHSTDINGQGIDSDTNSGDAGQTSEGAIRGRVGERQGIRCGRADAGRERRAEGGCELANLCSGKQADAEGYCIQSRRSGQADAVHGIQAKARAAAHDHAAW